MQHTDAQGSGHARADIHRAAVTEGHCGRAVKRPLSATQRFPISALTYE